MKKFSKLLLVVLAVALLATTVFSTLGSAATTSPEETALIGKANAIGVNRKVEDFTGEEILIKDNIIPGQAYADKSDENTVSDWIERDANTNNKYGVFATVDSKTGNRYARLTYEKAYAASGATYRTNIAISDLQELAKNDYLVYEWDMTTETQYPSNMGVYFYNTVKTSAKDRVKLFSMNATGDKLVIGTDEIDLGGAGAWHHFTIVISLVANGTDYTGSLGAIYMDGAKIGDFKPVTTSTVKLSHSIVLGYYNETREAVADNTTLCVDNIVATAVPKGYKAGTDNLAPLFNSTDPVTNLKLIGTDELVFNDKYELPAEPAFANAMADGTLVFYKSFAEAYTAFKAGGAKWIELYESAEAAIDAPVVVKLGENVTLTDTLAGTADAYPVIEAVGADGSVYRTFTKSTQTLTVRFFAGRKGTADATNAQLEVPFGVGVIPTIPEEYAPIQFSANPENLTKVFEVTDAVEIYLGDTLVTEMPLVTEAMIAESASVAVYPVYELKDVAFEVVETVDGVAQYYTQGGQISDVIKNAPDGAVITIRKNVGIPAKLTVAEKTLTIDLAGKALYQTGNSAFVPFEVKNATLNIYSSVAGGTIYCGKDSSAETMLSVTGDATSTVRVGFVADDAKDAFAGNLTVHTSTAVKVSAQANITFAGVDVKIVGAASTTYGIIELDSAKCKDTTVTFENVNVFNTYVENNVIAYSAAGANNTVTLKNTVVYAPAKAEANSKGFINVVGTFNEASTQKVVLDTFTFYGNLSGASVGDAGTVTLTIAGAVEAASVDQTTLANAQDLLFVNNNKVTDTSAIKYVPGGAFANWQAPVSGAKVPALDVLIAFGKTEADFCKVSWFFFEGAGVVEEYWAEGVVPEFRGEIPVSPEFIYYTFDGVEITEIAQGATDLTIEAKEVADIENLGLMQNVAIILGMDYNLHIPAGVPVTSVTVGDVTIAKEDMLLNADGTYYIVSLGEFTLQTLASANYAFSLNITTARSTNLTVSSVANVLDYFKSVYEDETLKIVEQRMVTAYLKYVQSAGNYLGFNTDAIAEVIAGKTTNYYLVDGLVETGTLRSAVKGVRMSLTEIPAFVFYLRETFSGTVTVAGTEYTVVNGVANEKNYILFTPASYAELGEAVQFNINGTLAGEAVTGEGAFALTNYLMGVREELGSTPTYILDLYQFFAVAKIVEDMRAEADMQG